MEFLRRPTFDSGDLLIDLGKINSAIENSCIEREQLINVGGVTAMLHACAAEGTTMWSSNWRGTHDLDMVLTATCTLDTLISSIEGGGFSIASSRKSRSIPNKWALEIYQGTGTGAFPSGRVLEIDIYPPNSKGEATINKRVIHPFPGKFINDQVEVLMLGNNEVTVPSIPDCIIMKTDVFPGIRDKDAIDINALIYAAELREIEANDLAKRVKNGYTSWGVVSNFWRSKVVPELKRVIKNPYQADYAPVSSDAYRSYFHEILS